jgi:hypothetical protein
MLGSVKKICLGIGCLASVAFSSYTNAAENAVAMASDAIPTSILGNTLLGLGDISVVGQITFPTVFVGPVYEGWYSTVRICFDGLGLLGIPLATSAVVQISVVNDAGVQIGAAINPEIPAGGCVTYTSDQPGDGLFSGKPLGVYKVVATNTAFLGIIPFPLTSLGSLNGSVNSTGRDVVSRPLSEFIAKGKAAQKKAGY